MTPRDTLRRIAHELQEEAEALASLAGSLAACLEAEGVQGGYAGKNQDASAGPPPTQPQIQPLKERGRAGCFCCGEVHVGFCRPEFQSSDRGRVSAEEQWGYPARRFTV